MALVGCKSASERAMEEYQIVDKSAASPAEKCRALRRLADAYLADRKTDSYETYSLVYRVRCE